uniref:Uncharacterized protein n=1 Tax=Anguilla anguilla TaxID=7936 RepID=A0A0E9SBZ2_ANGAN
MNSFSIIIGSVKSDSLTMTLSHN